MTTATRTRKCTRCQDANGIPTGIVRGGECFLCGGHGHYTREIVTAEAKQAGRRRAAAIEALRQDARYGWREQQARIDLEERTPERHAKLIESVMAGRVDAVVSGLVAYAKENKL
jgi:hypothetical protein